MARFDADGQPRAEACGRVLVDLMAWKAFHSEAINERLMIMYATNRLP